MPGPEGLDYARMESALGALASANRLRLLALLAEPVTLDKIHLPPSAAQAGASPGRPISRQAVLGHLRRLSREGLIEVRRAAGQGGPPANEYVADRAGIYGLLEGVRTVARLGTATPFEVASTRHDDAPREVDWPSGAKLVLARGAYEGKAFPLVVHGRSEASWRVGRRADAHVCLDYDPYASQDHCEIHLTHGEHRLRDLATAKNGTWLNWRPMPRGGEAVLQAGDMVGVGRSLLVFRTD